MAKKIEEVATELGVFLDKYEWYYATTIENNSICVYVHIMNKDVLSIIPYDYQGYHVKVGYEAYLNCADKYAATPIKLGSLLN